MAPTPTTEAEENPYDLLGIPQEATEAEIRTAYRTRSLKVHPDRNRNDPNAAQKFHALTVASTLLLDPLRRLALDAQLRLAAAKKARFSAYDNKRKALVTELEERERAFKKSRLEQEKQRVAREGENDRIKEMGRRMREDRERRIEELFRTKGEEAQIAVDEADEKAPPPLGPYDTTIRIKFTLSMFPSLNTAPALASYLRRFGEIDEDAVVLSIKPKKAGKKKKLQGNMANEGGQSEEEKVVNGIVPFSEISAAFAVVRSGATLKEQGVEVSWAGGSEPPILEWLRGKGELGGKLKQNMSSAARLKGSLGGNQGRADELETTIFSSFPNTIPSPPEPAKAANTLDFESLTLLRLREAERARLEREILEAEARGET